MQKDYSQFINIKINDTKINNHIDTKKSNCKKCANNKIIGELSKCEIYEIFSPNKAKCDNYVVLEKEQRKTITNKKVLKCSVCNKEISTNKKLCDDCLIDKDKLNKFIKTNKLGEKVSIASYIELMKNFKDTDSLIQVLKNSNRTILDFIEQKDREGKK